MNKDWIDIAVLEDYLDGKLDARAMNKVEREALEDPFVAEALAGLSAAPKRSLESISLLQKQLQERVAAHQHSKKATVITWQRLSIAAAAAVLFISVGIIFWMKQINYQDALAKQSKKVQVNLAARIFKDSAAKEETQAASVAAVAPDTLKAKAIDRAVALARSEAYASNKKARNNTVITPAESVPSPAAASEPVSVLNEVTVASASPARQKSVAFSSADVTTAADAKTVSGRVIDVKTGEPLPNAGIFASRPLKGVGTSDQDGYYSVTVPANATELTFVFLGYQSQNVKITGNSFDVAMRETSTSLNDVVIRGYQKRSKEQITGSSFVVSEKEVKDVPVANVEQLLQGKVAGLNIQNKTGLPKDNLTYGFTIDANYVNSIPVVQIHQALISNSQSEPNTRFAGPVMEWPEFNAYLTSNNRYISDAKAGESVRVRFEISQKRPVNITVIRGFSDRFNAEIIRLIKRGTDWQTDDPKNPVILLTIKY